MPDLVLTLVGPDRPGLVEAVAAPIAAHGGNWLESRMARLAGQFAGVLRVEVPEAAIKPLSAALLQLETRGLRVMVTHADTEQPLQETTRPMDLELVGLDRPGIVREISQLLAASGVNVEELVTDRSSAPMSGEMMFRARARVHLPETTDTERLRASLERLASDLLVEIRLAPPQAAETSSASGLSAPSPSGRAR